MGCKPVRHEAPVDCRRFMCAAVYHYKPTEYKNRRVNCRHVSHTGLFFRDKHGAVWHNRFLFLTDWLYLWFSLLGAICTFYLTLGFYANEEKHPKSNPDGKWWRSSDNSVEPLTSDAPNRWVDIGLWCCMQWKRENSGEFNLSLLISVPHCSEER